MPRGAAGASPESEPDVAATVRLLHRRRGWAWTGAGSLAGLVMYAIIGAHLFPNPTGAMAGVSAVVVLGLLALAVTGLIVAVVDTVRLHRRDTTVRVHAARRTSHYPVVAHAYRYPSRHRISAVFGKLMLAFWLILTVAFLPDQVNAVAYLAGAGPTATFFPSSYGQDCGRSGCSTVTNGILVIGGSGIRATWPGRAPLGLPFTVRAPVWDGWGSAQIVGDTPNAIAAIVVGAIFDSVAAIAVIAGVTTVRYMLRRRRQAAVPAAVG
jgi:hypothetical protein